MKKEYPLIAGPILKEKKGEGRRKKGKSFSRKSSGKNLLRQGNKNRRGRGKRGKENIHLKEISLCEGGTATDKLARRGESTQPRLKEATRAKQHAGKKSSRPVSPSFMGGQNAVYSRKGRKREKNREVTRGEERMRGNQGLRIGPFLGSETKGGEGKEKKGERAHRQVECDLQRREGATVRK